MSDISTECRGYKISFGDNSEEWSCSELTLYGFAKLSTLKARIDKLFLDERKKSAVQCFEISGYHGAEITPATIVEFIATSGGQKRSYGGAEPIKHKVAVVAQRKNSERAARRETELSSLMPDTPQAHEAWAVFVEKDRIAREAKKAADAAYEHLPRVTVEMVAELKRIKESGEES